MSAGRNPRLSRESRIDMDSMPPSTLQPAPLHFIFQNYSHLSVCAENCQPITRSRMQAEGGVPSEELLMAAASVPDRGSQRTFIRKL